MTVKPFLKYIGGKRRLAKKIIELLPPHRCYVEPFGGMGAVLLAKDPSKVEVWNDINGDLANVMRIVKYHPGALAEELSFMLMHRTERNYWFEYPGETDIQRAARWIMVRHTGHGGLPPKAGFRLSSVNANKSRDKLIEEMYLVSKRLSSVMIENLSWQRVIDLYDSDQTVFYLDPPYVDVGDLLYRHSMSHDQHRELREKLRSIKGQWVLSYADHPLVRDLYSDCNITTILYNTSSTQRKIYNELIITP